MAVKLIFIDIAEKSFNGPLKNRNKKKDKLFKQESMFRCDIQPPSQQECNKIPECNNDDVADIYFNGLCSALENHPACYPGFMYYNSLLSINSTQGRPITTALDIDSYVNIIYDL